MIRLKSDNSFELHNEHKNVQSDCEKSLYWKIIRQMYEKFRESLNPNAEKEKECLQTNAVTLSQAMQSNGLFEQIIRSKWIRNCSLCRLCSCKTMANCDSSKRFHDNKRANRITTISIWIKKNCLPYSVFGCRTTSKQAGRELCVCWLYPSLFWLFFFFLFAKAYCLQFAFYLLQCAWVELLCCTLQLNLLNWAECSTTKECLLFVQRKKCLVRS